MPMKDDEYEDAQRERSNMNQGKAVGNAVRMPAGNQGVPAPTQQPKSMFVVVVKHPNDPEFMVTRTNVGDVIRLVADISTGDAQYNVNCRIVRVFEVRSSGYTQFHDIVFRQGKITLDMKEGDDENDQ